MFDPTTQHPTKLLELLLKDEISFFLEGLRIVTESHERFGEFDFDIDVQERLKSQEAILVTIGSKEK